MDILELLSNRVYGPYVVCGAAIGLLILYVIGRKIYFVLFPSKDPILQARKRFEEEVEEHRNKPLGSGSESIGSISVRLGEDVRDVWHWGFSDEQINGVLTGKYTLEEMYKLGPDGKKTPRTVEPFATPPSEQKWQPNSRAFQWQVVGLALIFIIMIIVAGFYMNNP